jgi:hypothetical protein
MIPFPGSLRAYIGEHIISLHHSRHIKINQVYLEV